MIVGLQFVYSCGKLPTHDHDKHQSSANHLLRNVSLAGFDDDDDEEEEEFRSLYPVVDPAILELMLVLSVVSISGSAITGSSKFRVIANGNFVASPSSNLIHIQQWRSKFVCLDLTPKLEFLNPIVEFWILGYLSS